MNFSQLHVNASASFSICAYHPSVTVKEQEAYATGFQSLSPWRCIKTAPRPKEEASADTFDFAFGSYSASTVGFVSSSLRALKARSWFAPHSHARLMLSSSRRGLLISAMLGENFPIWFTIPINLRKLTPSERATFGIWLPSSLGRHGLHPY